MNFSIKNDNPFRIFAQLQNIAHEHRGAKNTIDLSRGDPGL